MLVITFMQHTKIVSYVYILVNFSLILIWVMLALAYYCYWRDIISYWNRHIMLHIH